MQREEHNARLFITPLIWALGDDGERAAIPMSIPIAIVAGIGSVNRSIGKASGLLRAVPDDLRRFAAKTIGKPVIMGRRTFESVMELNGLALPERPNIVLSRDPDYKHRDAVVCRSLDLALEYAMSLKPTEIHIGGGSEVYDQVIRIVDRLYLTLFDDTHEGEATFPRFENAFVEVCRHGTREHGGLRYEWVDYVRLGTDSAAVNGWHRRPPRQRRG